MTGDRPGTTVRVAVRQISRTRTQLVTVAGGTHDFM